jgi:hypothetical protein
MRVIACTPSRGLVHSRTVESIMQNISACHSIEWAGWMLTHDLPIPDCFEQVTEKALAKGADALWFVEEDMQPEPQTLSKMVKALRNGADIATVQYSFKPVQYDWIGEAMTTDANGKVTWCGMGCILINRRVFDEVPRPWFCTYNRLVRADGTVTWQGGESVYGCDVMFTFVCYSMGFEFAIVDAKVNHLRIIEQGKAGQNERYHIIEPLPEPEVRGMQRRT